MSDRAYKAIGYFVWRAGRFYVRQKLPTRRRLALSALVALGAAAAAALLVRRVSA